MADVRFRDRTNPVFDTMRGNIGLLREELLKRAEEKRKFAHERELGKIKDQPTTTITTKERPFGEQEYARGVLGHSPESLRATEGMGEGDVSRYAEQYTGEKDVPLNILGKLKRGKIRSIFTGEPETDIERVKGYRFTPQFEKERMKAQEILTTPRVTTRISGKFAGQPYETGTTDQDTQALIEEYQTTDDPDRLQELEQLLMEQGVNIQ